MGVYFQCGLRIGMSDSLHNGFEFDSSFSKHTNVCVSPNMRRCNFRDFCSLDNPLHPGVYKTQCIRHAIIMSEDEVTVVEILEMLFVSFLTPQLTLFHLY